MEPVDLMCRVHSGSLADFNFRVLSFSACLRSGVHLCLITPGRAGGAAVVKQINKRYPVYPSSHADSRISEVLSTCSRM